MKKISYKGYRFPPEIIQQAVWLALTCLDGTRLSRVILRRCV